MRNKYTAVRDLYGRGASTCLGMNAPSDDRRRFGTVADAFARDSAYSGDNQEGYIVAAVNRDSGILERANWEALTGLLTDAAPDDTVVIERASHWACGWVDYLIIKRGTPYTKAALRAAIYAHSSLDSYPILDEEIHSRIEDEDCRQVWEDTFNAKDRIDYMRRHSHTSSGPAMMIRACLRGDWYAAAEMLHCPSDLAHG